MGTAESIFYDDEPRAPSPSLPSAPVPAGQHRVQATARHGNYIHPSSRRNAGRPQLNDAAIDSEERRRQQRKTQLGLSEVQQNPNRPPIKRIEGRIVGGPKTGKRTLLRRLEGRDPFASKIDGGDTNNDNDNGGPAPSITIPYKPPPGSPSWNRIQLHITASSSASHPPTIGSNIPNFVVVMVSPGDDSTTSQGYFENILLSYASQLGYIDGNDGNDSAGREGGSGFDKDSKITTTQAASRMPSRVCTEPVCIAVLFNFRDVRQEKDVDPLSQQGLLDRIRGILESRNVPRNKIVLEMIDTSLLNCYGLDRLHQFIYTTYLQQRQADLEQQLMAVRNQLKLTHNEGRSTAASASYEEFLKSIAKHTVNRDKGRHHDQGAPLEPSVTDDSGTERTEASDDPSASPNQRRSAQEAATQQQASRQDLSLQSRRQPLHESIGRSRRQNTSSTPFGKEALEVFLASSSDEEGTRPTNRNIASSKQKHKKSNALPFGVHSKDDDDDDDDDDFFYDESGKQKFNHFSNRNRDSDDESSSSSDDELEVKVGSTLASSVKVSSPKMRAALESQGKVVEDSKPLRTQVNQRKGNETSEIEAKSSGSEEQSSPTQQLTRNMSGSQKEFVRDETDLSKFESPINVVQGDSPTPERNGAQPETPTADEQSCLDQIAKPLVEEETKSENENKAVSVKQDNDDKEIDSGPAAKCAPETNSDVDGDDDDDYIIGGTSRVESDGSDDDDYMIGSVPIANHDDEQDEDDDYKIGSAPHVAYDGNQDQSSKAPIATKDDGEIADDVNNEDRSDKGGSSAKFESEPNHNNGVGKTPEIVAQSFTVHSGSDKEAQDLKDENSDDSGRRLNEVRVRSLEPPSGVSKSEDDGSKSEDSQSNRGSPRPGVENENDDDAIMELEPPIGDGSTERSNHNNVADAKECLSTVKARPSPQRGSSRSHSGKTSPPPAASAQQPSNAAAAAPAGLSVAALAAIAAAQEEAEAMLFRQQQQQRVAEPMPKKSEKKSKKKKDGEKKTKKKKKDKSLDG